MYPLTASSNPAREKNERVSDTFRDIMHRYKFYLHSAYTITVRCFNFILLTYLLHGAESFLRS